MKCHLSNLSVKVVLAMYSPYFKTMFYSSCKEATASEVKLSVDYVSMLTTLRFIHHVDPWIDFVPKVNDTLELKNSKLKKFAMLYRTADMLDFPVVRAGCISLLKNGKPQLMISAAMELDLHDVVMEFLLKGKAVDIDPLLFAVRDYPKPLFSRKDVDHLFFKLYQSQPQASGAVPLPKEMEFTEIEDPRVDLTKKWEMSDVAIRTIGCGESLLYSNKQVLAIASPHFSKMLMDQKVAEGKENMIDGLPLISIDADFGVMKQILSIIHNCDRKFHFGRYYDPYLLYEMYLLASENQLAIPMIRDFVALQLVADKGNLENFSVAAKLELIHVVEEIQSKSSFNGYIWFFYGDKLSYLKHGDACTICISKTQCVLSARILKTLLRALTF